MSSARRPIGAFVALALVAALLGLGAGVLVGRQHRAPSDHSLEAGFARDMQTHHDQAVEMAWLIDDRTDSGVIRRLAEDIARTQENQSGQMAGWLRSWGLTETSSEPPMAWMARAGGHAEHSAPSPASPASPAAAMPGMASPAELERLRSARGRAADRLFLTLMIRHHQGGVPMAQTALAGSDRPEVQALSRAIVRSQSAEVETMRELLADL